MPAPSHSLRHRAKKLLRPLAIKLCGRLLQVGSRPYQLCEGAAVIIAPHQDDETLACGGLIARKRNEGLPVHVLFITDGAASHPHHLRFSPPAISTLRKQEAKRAMACLGVESRSIHFLDEPDGTLKTIAADRRESLIQQLMVLLRTIEPAEIFLPCHSDGSSEHDATFGFVLEAVARIRLESAIWQYPVWSWWNPGLLLRCWFATKDCRRLPLADYLLAKRQAIGCYQSQIAPLAPDPAPALPADLVALFNSETEYFFRYPLPDRFRPLA